jgi:peptide/nickel transport system substrate-binding protein
MTVRFGRFAMRRRDLLAAGITGAAVLSAPSLVRAQSATTLKFIPYADLALLDPAVSAFVTRNHVLMVFDTLFAIDEAGLVQYQMLAGHTVSPDGLTWTLTLRDGLTFHDNSPVLAKDAVASIKRWWVRDAFGQALAAATDDLSATSDKVLVFRLKRRFSLLPDALAHPTNTMAAIMPERLASTPPNVLLKEIIGSGPFKYMMDERVPGSRNVYAKFDGYVPRQEKASFCAGARIVNFDRVEWITSPDPATQVAALVAGEVDWVEQPLMDLVPSLGKNKAIKLQVAETRGLIGFLRFNHLYPPFDNPKIRQVIIKAVSQKEFMEAVVGTAAPFDAQTGLFTSNTPMANNAGMEALSGKHSIESLKKELIEAGYKGEKITYLTPTDVPRINAIGEVGADMLRKLGMNVDVISTDWGTTVQRSAQPKPLDAGGWNAFVAFTGGYDCSSPGSHQLMRGNGMRAYNGWPTLPKLEALRDEWLYEEDPAKRLALAPKIQMQALEDVPYLPLGSYYQPTAYKANLTNMAKGLILFTGVKRLA